MSAPRVAVIDYGIGNMHSIHKALIRVGARAALVTRAEDIDAADVVVLPGVGAFGACIRALERSGLRDATVRAAGSGRAFLGVCVGMQMLFDQSEEDPTSRGLGIIPGTVRWLPDDVKRPQMQWNRLECRPDPLWNILGERELWMYFVHSLHGVPDDERTVIATCDYGTTVNAAFRSGSVVATQFHPEKSAGAGLEFLSAFLGTAGYER